MTKDNNISIRVWIIFSVIALCGLGILAKVFVIQTTDKAKWDAKGSNLDRKIMTITPTRGRILSSDGSILAITVPVYSLHWDPFCDGIDLNEFQNEKDNISLALSEIFKDKDAAYFSQRFDQAINNKNRYKKIVDHIDYDQKQLIHKIPFIKEGRYKSGFIFEQTSIRQKFFGELASRTIGATGGDSLKGYVGLELTYDDALSGVEGKQMKERIPGGVWKPVTDNFIREPIEGHDLVSTIDVHLQDLVQTSLEKSLIKNQAEWGCAILMEVETGKIRGISNLDRNADSTYSEKLNYAINYSDDPGSTFKLPVLMAALEDGLIDITDSIDTGNGYKKFGPKEVTDSEKGHGKGSIKDVFAWSSNVGMTMIVRECYSKDYQAFLDGLNDLHLGDSLGIELIGEGKPQLYSSIKEEHWSGISDLQIAMGYEVGQTPLQTLAFYNAIANDGKYIQPRFAESLLNNGKIVQEFETKILDKSICSKNTLRDAQTMLKAVCEKGGTGYNTFKSRPYKVAGKTGTAWVYDQELGRYNKGDYRGSFVGYFPADNPKYSCIVVVNKPTGTSYYGSSVAGPVFRNIADMIFASEINTMTDEDQMESDSRRVTPVSSNGSTENLLTVYKNLNIPYKISDQGNWSSVSTQDSSVTVQSMVLDDQRVPDVRGMALQDAVFILENLDLSVKIEGEGRIKNQSPKKGAAIESNNQITLYLEP